MYDGEVPLALVVGAISRDVEHGISARPGGVVHYAARALAHFGAHTRVVTRVHPEDADELLAPVRAEGVVARAVASRTTTECHNDYSGEIDVHHIATRSEPIRPQDILEPEPWGRADLIQLGPLHREDIDPATLGVLEGFVGLDIQGLVRETSHGRTRLSHFDRIGDFLGGVSVVKASEPELPLAMPGRDIDQFRRDFGISELIVTRGAGGSSIATDAGHFEVPAEHVERNHPTGAGDVFLAAYLFARITGRPPLGAAEFASAASASKIQSGDVPKGFGSAREA